jgi:hypothetical protein
MSAEQLHASRAEQRKQRLLELERELDAEEAEALKITEVCCYRRSLYFFYLPPTGTTAVTAATIQSGQG